MSVPVFMTLVPRRRSLMSKKIIFKTALSSVLAFLAISNVFADDCNYGKVTLPSVLCYGSAELDGTTVTGDTSVFESMVATNANLGYLSMFGDAVLKETVVNNYAAIDGNVKLESSTLKDSFATKGNAEVNNSYFTKIANIQGGLTSANSQFKDVVSVNGPFSAMGSKFYDKIFIVTNKEVIVDSSSLGSDITIFNSAATPFLFLSSASVVAGNVIFQGNFGFVVATGGSKVIGQIINGALA